MKNRFCLSPFLHLFKHTCTSCRSDICRKKYFKYQMTCSLGCGILSCFLILKVTSIWCFFTVIKLNASEKGSCILLQTHISHDFCNLAFEWILQFLVLYAFWNAYSIQKSTEVNCSFLSAPKKFLMISLEHHLSYIFMTALLSTCFECSPTI